MKNQRDKLLGPVASSNFFKNVKAFRTVDKPKPFSKKELRPNSTDAEIAEKAAAFFNRISSEFKTLSPDEIPSTYHRDFPRLSPAQVQKMLQSAKKTSSMVVGDIFPKLINCCAASLAWPLSAIFNNIIRTYVWPLHWKREYVTIIPKKTSAKDFPDLSNISCTLFVSKVFERYLLNCLQEEISLTDNQYGGVKGCSKTHMINDILHEICQNAEDYRSATVLCAIDFAKAFNRMSFQHCLASLRKKNSSTPILKLIATFLSKRAMTVKVGNHWSKQLPVSGGCPQGSLLGIILFNATTEGLEDYFLLLEKTRLRLLPREENERTAIEEDIIQEEALLVSSSTPRQTGEVVFDEVLSPVMKPRRFDKAYQARVALKPLPQPVLVEPPTEEKVGTQVLTLNTVRVFMYVDDNISVDKVNFGTVDTTNVGGEIFKFKLAVNLQNGFRRITRKAEEMGMVINASKTTLLTVSDALNYRPRVNIFYADNNRIDSGIAMNLLGFQLSDRPNVSAHVDHIVKAIRRRYWTLFHLGKIGFNEGELVRVYRSMLLPIADY